MEVTMSVLQGLTFKADALLAYLEQEFSSEELECLYEQALAIEKGWA